MAAKKETDKLKTNDKGQTAYHKPSASSAGKRKPAASGKKTNRSGAKRGKKSKKKALDFPILDDGKKSKKKALDFPILDEVIIWTALALSIILFISNFGFGGFVGNAVSSFFFGIFGVMAYLFPIAFFLTLSFLISNRENLLAWMKGAAVLLLLICICTIVELAVNQFDLNRTMMDFYTESAETKSGGGLAGGVLCTLICPAFGLVGAYVIVLLLVVICMVLITERSLFQNVKKTGRRVYEDAREDAALRRERAAIREEKQRIIRNEYRKMKREALEEEKKELKNIPQELRRQQKYSGVTNNSKLEPRKAEPEEVHEIIPAVPGIKPEVQEGSLKVLDFTIDGKEFSIAPSEREKRESPELPFTDRRMMEPEVEEREEQAVPEFLWEQRPSSFEESLRRQGEEANSLTEPVFLQKEDPFLLNEEESEDIENSEPEEEFYEVPVREAEMSLEPQEVFHEEPQEEEPTERETSPAAPAQEQIREGAPKEEHKGKNPKSSLEEQAREQEHVAQEIELAAQNVKKEYVFPPIELLKKPKSNSSGSSERELRETAMKLQQTLQNFGVGVRVTNVSCGPTVTRYELTPEQGVKVSRIVNLTDDIKLNLAAADIRVEAPIPGKAAVGIEVPNQTNSAVLLRELLESKEFKEHSSSLAFAAGKDIGGKVVVADIAKMPHLLIAGATGSGKSVCINTIIVSILYKAKPEDVKLIMIDPKVVELSVYNGIPHLLIPVVTDPKKASGALNWAVAEMMDRYQKFAECNVRDLKGYNKKIAAIQELPGENKPEKMPQIVIIVDELADLMMVAPGEVEDAICRLAQLARAAGIHLIIATQRPSVNVITGLIKANMPSRIAFAVSSGVDSRTIIDMHGAEKLLGKGDMLFYPQGYKKPARVQGAFVSDSEVGEVVSFLTEENSSAEYSSDIEEQITQAQKMTVGGEPSGESNLDEYFEKAGRFIIEKDKASIGMLQRVLKVGFNRAARIMDQLADAGVVGPEEGTKPRKILMSMEQFEAYLSDYV